MEFRHFQRPNQKRCLLNQESKTKRIFRRYFGQSSDNLSIFKTGIFGKNLDFRLSNRKNLAFSAALVTILAIGLPQLQMKGQSLDLADLSLSPTDTANAAPTDLRELGRMAPSRSDVDQNARFAAPNVGTLEAGARNSRNEALARDMQVKKMSLGRVYPTPALEKVRLLKGAQNHLQLQNIPNFTTKFGDKFASLSERNEFVLYSVDPALQDYTESLVASAKSPHIAIVAMDPRTGRILAMADKSESIRNLSLHTGFPAASLFKLVTSAAALEQSTMQPESTVKFRGGTYTLNQWNIKPDVRKDRRSMTLAEALGMSCNPVFARVALLHLDPETLRTYANRFGFNADLNFDYRLPISRAYIPSNDFDFGRTAAGFGEVTISPVHAAALAAGIANGGMIPRPSLIDQVVSPSGDVVYATKPEFVKKAVSPETARKLMDMMEYTTTMGTSRREFMKRNRPVLPGIPVAAKTGTLKGPNPKGLNHWFIAAAPIEDPQIAVSVILVNPRARTKASNLGKQIIERYIRGGESKVEERAQLKLKRKK